MIYNHISLSQKEPDKRKMIQNGSENIIRFSLGSADVTSAHFSFLLPAFECGFRCSHNGISPVISIISLYLWYQVYFVIIIVEILVAVLNITYLQIFSEGGLLSF